MSSVRFSSASWPAIWGGSSGRKRALRSRACALASSVRAATHGRAFADLGLRLRLLQQSELLLGRNHVRILIGILQAELRDLGFQHRDLVLLLGSRTIAVQGRTERGARGGDIGRGLGFLGRVESGSDLTIALVESDSFCCDSPSLR